MNISDSVLPFRIPAKVGETYKAFGGYLDALPFSQRFDDSVCRWVLQWHPWFGEKVGDSRVAYFKKERNLGSYVLKIVREDGVIVDFSYRKCVKNYLEIQKGNPPLRGDYGYFEDLKKAMRAAIQPDIDAWATAHAATKRDGDEVDHVHPFTFSYLSDLFLRSLQAYVSYGESWKTHLARVLPSRPEIRDGGEAAFFFSVLRDAEVARAWRNFHAETAVLRWLTEEDNSRNGNRTAGGDDLPRGTPLRDFVDTESGWWS